MLNVINVSALTKAYKKVIAVDDISFEVRKGEVFALLGLNGAGKTTTIEILEGILEPDQGSVSVLGYDISRKANKVKQDIGVQLQDTDFYREIKVREIFEQFSKYYNKTRPIDELLQFVGLTGKKEALLRELSSGQRQKVAFALALINDPKIIFLDEPTAGVDAKTRHAIWNLIRGLKGQDITVFLTTHYLHEAESLCDRVAILHKGQIIAMDEPDKLIAAQSSSRQLTFKTFKPLEVDNLVAQSPFFENFGRSNGAYVLKVNEFEGALIDLSNIIKQDNALRELHTSRDSLEDIFIELTKED